MTENDWVCDLEMRATDLFTLGNVGLILGTAVFSALADYKGRRLAFYVATAFMIVFQLIQIGVSHIYPLFVTMKVIIIINFCMAFKYRFWGHKQIQQNVFLAVSA